MLRKQQLTKDMHTDAIPSPVHLHALRVAQKHTLRWTGACTPVFLPPPLGFKGGSDQQYVSRKRTRWLQHHEVLSSSSRVQMQTSVSSM